MVTARSTVRGKGWIRGVIVAILASAAACMMIFQPVVAKAAEQEILYKEKDGTLKILKIKYDDWVRNISATVDGKPLKVSDEHPYPIVLGENTKKIVGIYGPVVVFEGNSSCYLIGGRWIGYPPGTKCP
jgi:hypothetical protein